MTVEKLVIQRILDQDEDKHQVILRASDSQWLDRTSDLLYQLEGQQQTDRLTIKSQDTYQVLAIPDILYAEINQGELTIWTKDKTYPCRLSLKKLESLLPKGDYLRASRYSLVRLDAIQSLELAFSGNMYAQLSNQKKILISRRFLQQFKEKLGLWKEPPLWKNLFIEAYKESLSVWLSLLSWVPSILPPPFILKC